jgi:hypothetical protein
MFDAPAIWVALASFVVGIGGTVLAFKSDLRNLTTRFEQNVIQQTLQRKSDKQLLNVRLSFMMQRIEDIAAALNVDRRDVDMTNRFLALDAGEDTDEIKTGS